MAHCVWKHFNIVSYKYVSVHDFIFELIGGILTTALQLVQTFGLHIFPVPLLSWCISNLVPLHMYLWEFSFLRADRRLKSDVYLSKETE